MSAAYAWKGNVKKAIANIKKSILIGGKETLEKLKKDKGENFCSLYDNEEFKRLRAGKWKKDDRKRVKK